MTTSSETGFRRKFLLLAKPVHYEAIRQILPGESKVSVGDDTFSSFSINGQCSKGFVDVVGIAVDPSEMEERGTILADFADLLQIRTIVVVWEMPAVCNSPVDDKSWLFAFQNWPLGIEPLFLEYNTLMSAPKVGLEKIMQKFGISDCAELRLDDESTAMPHTESDPDILSMYRSAMEEQLGLPSSLHHLFPDREPTGSGKWHYRVAEPYLPETAREYVLDAIDGRSVSSAGIWPVKLEHKLKEIFNVPVAQPCSNGFTALVLALQSARVKHGDQVLIPTFTMVAVVNAVHFVGATAVFMDNDSGSYNPGLTQIEASATEQTKAVILCHTYGVPAADIESIAQWCLDKNVVLIEDISECIGIEIKQKDGTRKMLGTFGDYAGASMYANKLIHGADGGFVLAKNLQASGRLKSLTNHAFTPKFHFVHFEHAMNAKITGLGAAMALACIENLDYIMEHRKRISSLYSSRLNIPHLRRLPQCGERDTPWVFGVECENKQVRRHLRQYLTDRGIETRDYFFPLHLQPLIQVDERQRLPESERLASTGFYLPTHTNLTDNDVTFICCALKSFFDSSSPAPTTAPSGNVCRAAIRASQKPPFLEVRVFAESGELRRSISSTHAHHLLEAVQLKVDLEEFLIWEQIDEAEQLLKQASEVIQNTGDGDPMVNDYLQVFTDYISAQKQVELPTKAPWLHMDIYAEKQWLKNIPTTTDYETLQLFCWLAVEHNVETFLELGCWFGHASALIAETIKQQRRQPEIVALDGFKWQHWMNEYLPGSDLVDGSSFLPKFGQFVQPVSSHISPIQWFFEDEFALPEEITSTTQFDLVFPDFSRSAQDIEHVWQLLIPHLKPGKTVILINDLTHSLLPFITNHSDVLLPIAKPHTHAKAFLYQNSPPQVTSGGGGYAKLDRKFCFVDGPGWDQLHLNAFEQAIQCLREHFHNDSAEVLFIPALEQYICDNPQPPQQPWVGVVHSVERYPEHYYVPDLERLCSERYDNWFANCRGLFTLSEFQREYLLKNRSPKFPISAIKYPLAPTTTSSDSTVIDGMRSGRTIDIVLIGSYARAFDYFCSVQVPDGFRKVLLIADETMQSWAQSAPASVTVIGRADKDSYERILSNSIPCLTLRYKGAANTLILECIARNLPVLAPRLSSCEEYLGTNYPLLYEVSSSDWSPWLTSSKMSQAIEFMRNRDKTDLIIGEKWLNSITDSVVMQYNGPHYSDKMKLEIPLASRFDVTVGICSYRRTHNLEAILQNLVNQNFTGSMEIILWNNNECRAEVVADICNQFRRRNTHFRAVEIIQSTENVFCASRLSIAHFMRSDRLIVVDDDVIPGLDLVDFFMQAHQLHPRDLLCVRGHRFLPHQLTSASARETWLDYEYLRFFDDDAPEMLVHFAHVDACLIPRDALLECAAYRMPQADFALVDDYWLSFVLNSQCQRDLRKLSTKNESRNTGPLLSRTADSDTPGVAMHTRVEVQDAKLRLYVHHMLAGWPVFPKLDSTCSPEVAKLKKEAWNTRFLGFNISSRLTDADIADLQSLGVKWVRIGAMQPLSGDKFDFSNLQRNAEKELLNMKLLFKRLEDSGINVVITLDYRMASAENWSRIAQICATISNVVGYDLVSRPPTFETAANSTEETAILLEKYCTFIKSIREFDKGAKILLQPVYDAKGPSFEKLMNFIGEINDENVVASWSFFEPEKLTWHPLNKGRFGFPGSVAVRDRHTAAESLQEWDSDVVSKHISTMAELARERGYQLVFGETGICCNVRGAKEYLQTVLDGLRELSKLIRKKVFAAKFSTNLDVSAFLNGFRDPNWDRMNYELGPGEGPKNMVRLPPERNELMTIIKNAIP